MRVDDLLERNVLAMMRMFCGFAPPIADGQSPVESRCDAVALGWVCLLPPLSSGGARITSPLLRFHTPLIEPDMQISRIRLSDRTSRLRTRQVTARDPSG